MRRPQKDHPSPSLETQNLPTQARSTLDIALARGSSEAHVVIAHISRRDFAQVLHRPRCVEPKQVSREQFVLLGQFVLMSQALTGMGYSPEARPQLLLARTALIQVHERAADSGVWGFLEPEYLLLRESVGRFAGQLDFASYEHVAKAEIEMLAYLGMEAETA